MVVVQPEERNMYDQHWLSTVLKERYPFPIVSMSCFNGLLLHVEFILVYSIHGWLLDKILKDVINSLRW